MATPETVSEGKFEERFPKLMQVAMRYWILETDYKNYYIAWSCRDVYFLNRQYLWVYTRKRVISESEREALRYKIGYRGLDSGPLMRSVQECPNYNGPV